MTTVIIIILIISNVLSWAVIMRLVSEIKQTDKILEGLSDTFKEMAEK